MLTAEQRNAHNKKYREKNLEKHREWNRKSYAKHRGARQEYLRTRYAERRAFVDSLKAKPCLDCGRSYPSYVMEFHHRDPRQKDFKVSTSLVYYNIEVIKREIAKCDVLCANCHRIREWGENGLRRAA
jgi:hypothetical protein